MKLVGLGDHDLRQESCGNSNAELDSKNASQKNKYKQEYLRMSILERLCCHFVGDFVNVCVALGCTVFGGLGDLSVFFVHFSRVAMDITCFYSKLQFSTVWIVLFVSKFGMDEKSRQHSRYGTQHSKCKGSPLESRSARHRQTFYAVDLHTCG